MIFRTYNEMIESKPVYSSDEYDLELFINDEQVEYVLGVGPELSPRGQCFSLFCVQNWTSSGPERDTGVLGESGGLKKLFCIIYIAMLVSEEKGKSRMLICISVSENLWPISDSIRSLIVWRRF